jgi:hypothetical protein
MRKLTKMQDINKGDRSLIESTMMPEIIIALRDWARSTGSAVLIGALGLSYHCKPRYTQDIDFIFLEPSDVPDAVGGFSRIGSGFQHNRTRIAVDIFTPSSINIPKDVAEQVMRTVVLSDNIRVASASGLVALKLFRSSMQDRADIVALIKTGHVDLSGWPLSPEMLAAFEALVVVARTELA